MNPPLGRPELLAIYDERLRTDAELLGTERTTREGPLHIGVFPGGDGFITYRDLGDVRGARLDSLIRSGLDAALSLGALQVEWKTRGHDAPADLPERLRRAGLVAGESETVVMGAIAVALEAPALPEGVTIERVDPADADGVAHAARLAQEVFGGGPGVDDLARRLEDGHGRIEQWAAYAGSRSRVMVGTARLDMVPEAAVGGLWGGAVRADWRGRGIYRALTAARARSAAARGATVLQSDCLETSRPILERLGLVSVTTTTPYTRSL